MPDVNEAGAQPETAELTVDEQALAAMDEGLEASGEPQPEPEPEPEPEAEPAPEGEEPEPVPGTPEAAAKAEKDAPKPEAKQPDQATEDEIKGLGLKEKSAERFRDMAAQIRELAPVRDALEKAGIKDINELPKVLERSKAADDMISMVMDTGSTAEQYSEALDYLKLLNQAQRTGDAAAAKQALDMLRPAYEGLARLVGEDVSGVDVLAEHPDLKEAVESGDITRKHAAELAAARQRTTLATRHTEQQTTQQQSEAAKQQGLGWLQQFDQQALAQDPDYQAKRPLLNVMVKNIRDTLPPEKWPAATQQAYASLAHLKAAALAPAPQPKPTPGPVRPGGPRPTMTPQTDDPLEAFDIGYKQAREAGM